MSSIVARRAYLAVALMALMTLLSVLAPAASALPSEAPTSPPTTVVVYNGDSASMGGQYTTSDGHLCGFSVDTGRSGSARVLTTNVSVYLDVWDPVAWPCDKEGCPEQDGNGPGACVAFGGFWGEIPNASFARDGLAYSLKTTVTVEAWDDCGKEGCPEPPPPKPEPIVVPIDLAWQRTATWESSSHGTFAYRWMGMFQRSVGSWTSYSATGSGTFLGSPVSSSDGGNGIGASVSTNRQVSICRAPAGSDACTGGGK